MLLQEAYIVLQDALHEVELAGFDSWVNELVPGVTSDHIWHVWLRLSQVLLG